jgi:hypothetical protein
LKKKWGFRRYNAMLDWWLENGPPVYVSVASYLGLVKPKSSQATGDLGDLIKMADKGGNIS